MAEGQNNIKTKLLKLHCPFTWELLEDMLKYASNKNKHDEPMDDTVNCSLEELLILLLKCYEAVSSADEINGKKIIEKAEVILMEIQQEKEFHNIIRVIEHVFYATKCFFLYEIYDMDGIEEILPNIIDAKDFSDIELGALYGCQSIMWSCLYDFGINKVIDLAKKAVEKNQDCALWHFILAKNLRRQRRLINLSSDVSDMEKRHFEIAYAISKNDMFGISYLQMRLECFYKFCKDSAYVAEKINNERVVIQEAKNILKRKPNYKVLLKLSRIFLRVSSDERLSAKECLDAVNKVDPNNNTYLHYMAMFYQESGDYMEAMKYFKKAAECNNFPAEINYVQYGWEIGDLEPLPHLCRMLKKYEQSIKERRISILLAIAVAYYSLYKDMPNAAIYFIKALTVDPLNQKFKIFYKFFDFKTKSISFFLNNTFCPQFEKKYSKTHQEICKEMKNLLNIKHMNDLVNEWCTLSITDKEKSSN